VGKQGDPGDIPERPQALPGPAALIDADGALLAGLDTDSFQAEFLGTWPAPGAEDHHVGLHRGAVVKGDNRATALAPDAGDGAAGVDGDAVPGERLGGELADTGVLAVHEPGAPLDDGRLGAHPGVELAELDADGTAAHHQHPARDVTHRGGLPVGPHGDAVEAVDGGPHGL
jgi:hypothetical protein